MTKARITTALRRAGRQRLLEQTADRIQQALRRPQLHQPELVEQTMGRRASTLLSTLNTECVNT